MKIENVSKKIIPKINLIKQNLDKLKLSPVKIYLLVFIVFIFTFIFLLNSKEFLNYKENISYTPINLPIEVSSSLTLIPKRFDYSKTQQTGEVEFKINNSYVSKAVKYKISGYLNSEEKLNMTVPVDTDNMLVFRFSKLKDFQYFNLTFNIEFYDLDGNLLTEETQKTSLFFGEQNVRIVDDIQDLDMEGYLNLSKQNEIYLLNQQIENLNKDIEKNKTLQVETTKKIEQLELNKNNLYGDEKTKNDNLISSLKESLKNQDKDIKSIENNIIAVKDNIKELENQK